MKRAFNLNFVKLSHSRIHVVHRALDVQLIATAGFGLKLEHASPKVWDVYLQLFDGDPESIKKVVNMRLDRCLPKSAFPHRHVLSPRDVMTDSGLRSALARIAEKDTKVEIELDYDISQKSILMAHFYVTIFKQDFMAKMPVSKLKKILTSVRD